MSVRNKIVLVIGVVMMGLGVYVGSHPFWSGGHTVTESRLLDVMLTLFFLLRGWMNVRSALGRPFLGVPRA